MEKEFIPYELAVKMKALGFDEPCFSFYMGGFKDLGKIKYVNPSNVAETNVLAPTFSQAFRWFREKHDYAGFIQLVDPEYGGDYGYVIYYNLNYLAVDHWNKGFNSYEEAELACLDKLLEIVESKSE